MVENYHIPVLLHESIEALNINSEGIYVDATFGGGGHSKVIFSHLKSGKLIAFDQDNDAHKNAWDAKNFILFNSNFQFIKNFLDFLKISQVDGILADLGLSTHHIDTPHRGFSFRFDADLDMRMNTNQDIDAKHIINTYNSEQLTAIFREYGELDFPHKLAEQIVTERRIRTIKTTYELVESIRRFIPKNAEHKFLSKVFQAIRIEVNNEIETLKNFLTASTQVLKKDGRLVVISYHSLEDKIVKNYFKTGNFEGERITDFYGNITRPLEPMSNKVIVPDENEILKNNRARSAKLRIGIKL